MWIKLSIYFIIFLKVFSSFAFSEEKIWFFYPAYALGNFKIGDDYNEVQRQLGSFPNIVKEVKDGYLVKFSALGIIVQYNRYTMKVQFIGVDTKGYKDISYKTETGISVGSSRTQVERVYGMPTQIVPVKNRDFYPKSYELAIYIDKGIAFHYDENSQVVVIIVFDPSIFKLF